MKETVNVNIGSQAFTMDEDAYGALRTYLDDIASRLPEGDTETLDDIERGMAEIFRERISSPMLVVTLAMVREAMSRMGRPSDFGESRAASAEEQSREPQRAKLYRSRTNRSIAGVCGGIAAFIGADATVLRLLTLVMILLGGLSIWVYVILWIVIPEEPVKRPSGGNNR
ncbi:MAG: PspC domain-containing protein, partial [Alistipes sp.]|nr:PspC domain-containing protein [Alistipes sp.]